MSKVSDTAQIFRLPGLQRPVYVADGLTFLPPFLSAEFTVRRSAARDRVVEILVAELGDGTHKSPFLIVSLLEPLSFTLRLIIPVAVLSG